MTDGDLFDYTPRRFNKSLVRQSYANAIDTTARLTTYSLAQRLVHTDDEVAERCRQLAADDLVHLSISLRRLIESTSLYDRANNVWVSKLKFASNDFEARAIRSDVISLWKVLGVVVHSRMIEVVDSETALAVWFSDDRWDTLMKRAFYKPQWIDPVCLVRSDRTKEAFHLSEFSGQAAILLECAREACDAQGLFLSSLFDD